MRINSKLIAILFLLLLASSQLNVKVADANFMGPPLPNIFIRADGSIDPSNATIQQDGGTYSLTGNLVNYALIIQCDNIVIDGKGFTLKGRGAAIDIAITLAQGNMSVGRQNITVENFNIEKFAQGIFAPGLSGSIIRANTINCTNAINLSYYSSNNQIIDNTLIAEHQNAGCGIWVDGSSNTINGNKISKFHTGIEIFEGQQNSVTDNVLVNTTLVNHATNTILRNNLFRDEEIITTPSPSPPLTPTLTPTAMGLDYGGVPVLYVVGITVTLLIAILTVVVIHSRRHKPELVKKP